MRHGMIIVMEKINKQSLSAKKNKQLKCTCMVCKLLLQGFSGYDFQEKKSIISSGRRMPVLNLETKVVQSAKQFTRHFKIDFYDKYKWLTGCNTLRKLFCWPCLLFSSEKIPWNSTGLSDLNNFHKNVKKHVNSRGHLTAVIKEKTFGKTRIDHSLDTQLKLNHGLHNELVRKNREILKRLIDVTCFLGERELSLTSHPEDESTNSGNYIGLIKLLVKYDEPLRTHLKDSTGFQGTSDRIQNDLIKCVAEVVFDSIKKEIKDAPFVSIALSEITDTTNVKRLTVVVRYVKSNESVRERFLRFLDIPTDKSAEAIYKIVCDIVEELECGSKLVAQSYDGAAVMVPHLQCLQAKVKDKFKNAIFVHCFAHRLNLILSQGLGVIRDCKVFFSMLSGIADFFSKSAKRTCALGILVQNRFPNGAPIRWNCNRRLVLTVSQNRLALIELFQDILDKEDQWDAETVIFSRGYLQLLENDYNFNFLLNVFSEIFVHTDLLCDVLKVKSNDIDVCVENINAFEKKVNAKRDQFKYIWEKSLNLNLEPQRKIIRLDNVSDTEEAKFAFSFDMETSYHRLYLEIMDNITQQLRARFENFNELKFIELCHFKKYDSHFPEESFDSLKLNYGNLFDTAALQSQLNVLYDTAAINNQDTPLNMLLFLKGAGLEESYGEVFNLCQLVLTIPVTSVLEERSFSTLKRIKSFVRNTVGEQRLTNLAVVSIEAEYIKELSQNPKFYEDVTDKFAGVERRIQLHYQ